MAAVGRMDELVKDYLMFRGFTSALKALEMELRNDKDRGFRVDKIMDLLNYYIVNHDLTGLRELWGYLDSRLFCRLEQIYTASVRKLEVSLLKIYLINCVQNNKHDKVTEFFEKLTPEIQTQYEWREWFVLPYIRNPEDNNVFAMYFTKQWQDTFLVSLHNFLSVIFQSMPVPMLLNFEEDQRKLSTLQGENEIYKQQASDTECDAEEEEEDSIPVPNIDCAMKSLENVMLYRKHSPELETVYEKCLDLESQMNKHVAALLDKKQVEIKLSQDRNISVPSSYTPGASPLDLMDDFFVISQDENRDTVEERPPRANQIKSFIKNIGLPVSPMSGKKTEASGNVRRLSGSQAPRKDEIPSSAKTKPKEVPIKTRTKSSQQQTAMPPASAPQVATSGTNLGTGTTNIAKTRSSKDEQAIEKEKTEIVEPSVKVKEKTPSNEECSAATGRDQQKTALTKPATEHKTSMTEQRSPARLPPEGILQETTALQGQSSPARKMPSTTSSTAQEILVTSPDSLLPFLLLSQEEYGEHRSSITHCRFSNTGHLVATSDVDGVVKVWSLQPSPVTMATIMSKSMLLSLEWASKMDRLLLLGSKAGSVRLFDVKEKKTLKEAMTDQTFPRITSLCSSPSGSSFVCASAGKVRPVSVPTDVHSPRSGKLSVWDLKTMKIERYLPLASSPVAINCTAFNHNGQLLVAGGADGTLRLFDMQKHECIATWPAHQGEVYSVQFSTDELSCFSMGSDGKFSQWSVNKTGKKMADLAVHAGACGPFIMTGAGGYRQVQTPKGRLFAFDAEGQFVLTCSTSGGLIYKMSKEGTLNRTLMLGGHKAPVVSVDWSSAIDCRTCLTGSMDGKVRVSTLLAHCT